ncbi:Biofilm operon icaADBC HTH-type negative transcriptional regulator IcaR [Arthrobacter saudimassiliensis]|uniref:Biofilm operon icaADBC HTH-type negative transcriptional regulator IcaR n=1 Tax=Arthrobacter saudimassiliensis TaxID=1461584 RepID=A0A078MPZ4_9MICC|nr:Biofilm operon icaADBC HTH-type negative transcriptional regulator IcaR [Arthrobacter saudimassiliensis]
MTRRSRAHQSTPGNEQAILEAALSLAVTAGYEGTTMAEVARLSGLPVGSVYWHFNNKEQLFAELIEYCFEQWKVDHTGPTNRDLLRRSIAGSAGGSTDPGNRAEAFWILALLFALEKRLADNLARQKYLEVRKQMFELMVQRVEPQIPAAVLARDPDFGRKMVVLGRALTDGFYIAASAGDDVDFAEFADLSASAVEALIARHAAAALEEDETPDAAPDE